MSLLVGARSALLKPPVVAVAGSSASAPVLRGSAEPTSGTTNTATTTAYPANSLAYSIMRFNGTATLDSISLNGGANDIANWDVQTQTNGVYTLIAMTKPMAAGLAAGSIVLTISASASFSARHHSIAGADLTAPLSATPTKNSGTGTATSISITPANTGDLLLIATHHRNAGTWTSDTGGAVGTTQFVDQNFSIGHLVLDYKVPVGTTSAVNYAGSNTGSSEWETIAHTIKGA